MAGRFSCRYVVHLQVLNCFFFFTLFKNDVLGRHDRLGGRVQKS